MRREDVARSVLCSSDLGRHAAWLREILDLGVDELFIHHVPRAQADFIEAYGEKVLPEVA